MKKALIIFLCAGFVFFGTGCASSGDVLLAQKDPIALVSVVSNWDINWKGEASLDPSINDIFVNRLLRRDPDLAYISNADELINTAELLFRNTVAASSLINLAEKDKVLLSGAYREAKTNRYQVNKGMTKPEGYRLVDYGDKNFHAAMAKETGLQRSLFVEFDFTTEMVSGLGKNGNGRANADMKIIVLDSHGKTLYRKVFTAWSRTSTKVSSGVYSGSELMNLFEEAIIEAVYDFLEKISY